MSSPKIIENLPYGFKREFRKHTRNEGWKVYVFAPDGKRLR